MHTCSIIVFMLNILQNENKSALQTVDEWSFDKLYCMPTNPYYSTKENVVWVKKDNPDFDVTMSSYDGPEVCELVGL